MFILVLPAVVAVVSTSAFSEAITSQEEAADAPLNSDEAASLLQLRKKPNASDSPVDPYAEKAFGDYKKCFPEEESPPASPSTISFCATQFTCRSCMEKTDNFGGTETPCRWCPKRQRCYSKYTAPDFPCITDADLCWSELCPNTLGTFSTSCSYIRLLWNPWTVGTMDYPLEAFPTLSNGDTGMYDINTGNMLQDPLDATASPDSGDLMSFVGAWGAGTCEAKYVGSKISERSEPLWNAMHVIHLGDVFQVGTKGHFRTNMMGEKPSIAQEGLSFPKGTLSTFFMNANREMISGGAGLFEEGFSYTGQTVTYRAYMNAHWRLILLDTGYNSYTTSGPNQARNAIFPRDETDGAQPQEVLDWLVNTVKLNDPNDRRGIAIFTHHQPISNWEAPYLGTAKQLDEIIPAGRTILWFSAQEHRLATYQRSTLKDGRWESKYSVIHRSIGSAGFPTKPLAPPRVDRLVAFDMRVYQNITDADGNTLAVGFNDWVDASFEGDRFEIFYKSGWCNPDGCEYGLDLDPDLQPSTLGSDGFRTEPADGNVRWISRSLSNSLTCWCESENEFRGCANCGPSGGLNPQTAILPSLPDNVPQGTRYGTLIYSSMD